MSIPSSDEDEIGVAALEEEMTSIDEPVSGGISPCAVYRQGPGMGRVTTPMGDLSFTNLFGSDTAMMRELGRCSASEFREGAYSFFRQFNADVVESMVPRPVARLGNWALENWLFERLKKAIPAPYLKMLRAYAEGSGYEVQRVVAGQLTWDIWALLAQASLDSVQRAAARARRHSPLLGSTSVILPGESCGPLHLRWLDNAAIDRWERKTSVAFFHPNRGIPYVFVSSVGFSTGLPAGMNAAGLSVSVEPADGGDIDWSGAPMAYACHEILRQAHTIEEAAAILGQRSPLTAWRYVICEGDTGRADVYVAGQSVEPWEGEKTPPFVVGCADGSPPGRSLARVERWLQSRRDCLDAVINQWSSKADDAVFKALQAMTQSTPDHAVAPGLPLSGLGNVGAVLFEPANRRLWVATGRAPVGMRWFVPLTFRAEDGRSGGGLDRRVRPIKPAGEWENTKPGRAMEHLRHAMELERDGENQERTLISLEHSLALDPKCPSFHILAGLMALRVGRGRRAQGAFEQALALLEDPIRRAEVGVYRAWALDIQRRRREARKAYRKLAKDASIERTVRRWARRGYRRRFRRRDTRKFYIDFFLAAAVEC